MTAVRPHRESVRACPETQCQTPTRARGGAQKQARTRLAKGRFLATFRHTAIVAWAATSAGIHRRTVYRWLKDHEFRTLYVDALEEAYDRLLEEASRRAIRGVLVPIVSAGRVVTHVRKKSDALLITLLKIGRPEVYCERRELTVRPAATHWRRTTTRGQ